MAPHLPTPIRVAAGLVGATLDRLSSLPAELPTIGVTVAGQAFRLSLKARQQIAGLAARGDELLAGLGGKPEDKPAWATFDEDEDEDGPAEPAAAEPAAAEPAARADAGSAAASPTATKPTATKPTATKPTAPAPTAPVAPANGNGNGIGALKESLAGLGADQVQALLDAEQAGAARAAHLTVLENRLATLRAE
ncbi:lipid droplet-associated protein [Nakamurella sp. YIM 132087]|uniref:Lipid droplet-associated protein n=1 Tax=Nakamurella alba TaxID=2665158 RepID=A0A7K1FHV5_9ACTN|nr:lipid droplet-associated protein [Nakamurella alba]MTD12863.1 lipid droplet-associated protein [Nakamurella alba]